MGWFGRCGSGPGGSSGYAPAHVKDCMCWDCVDNRKPGSGYTAGDALNNACTPDYSRSGNNTDENGHVHPKTGYEGNDYNY